MTKCKTVCVQLYGFRVCFNQLVEQPQLGQLPTQESQISDDMNVGKSILNAVLTLTLTEIKSKSRNPVLRRVRVRLSKAQISRPHLESQNGLHLCEEAL